METKGLSLFFLGFAFGVLWMMFLFPSERPPEPSRISDTMLRLVRALPPDPDPFRSARQSIVGEAKEIPAMTREAADQAFVDRRRAGFVTWDHLSDSDQDAVQNVIMLHRINHNLLMGTLHPNLFGIHPEDRRVFLNEFSELMAAEVAVLGELEKACAATMAKARLNQDPEHYELLHTSLRTVDPRWINGADFFAIKWQIERGLPGYYEPAGHHIDEASGLVHVSMHWIKPTHPAMKGRGQWLLDSQTRRRELASILFPRLYHEVK